MEKSKIYDNIDDYINVLNRLGINKVAFSEIDEKRAEQVDENVLSVVRLRKLEVLAYHDSIIYKCVINDADLDGVHEFLIAEGFETKRINRNIT